MTSISMRRVLLAMAGIALLVGFCVVTRQSFSFSSSPQSTAAEGAPLEGRTTQPLRYHGLPVEALETISLIQRGGPFPYSQDGTRFANREKRLPIHAHDYYREYTVRTPNLNHRGGRRIVVGGAPPKHWYYTENHYRSFREFSPPPSQNGRIDE